MLSRPNLRRSAREQLGGNVFASAWLSLLGASIVASLLLSVSSAVVIGPILLFGPLSYGLTRISMRLARGENNGKVDFGDLFKGFSDDFGQTLVLGLMIEVYTLLWSLLFIIPGIIKSYSYSMAFYIQNDSPNKDWSVCLRESKQMMKGHKWELFVLDLSFFGWFIVGYLCCCIGMFWVDAYRFQSRTNFYEQLRGAKAEGDTDLNGEKTEENPLH